MVQGLGGGRSSHQGGVPMKARDVEITVTVTSEKSLKDIRKEAPALLRPIGEVLKVDAMLHTQY
jgi:hypothetical protein